MSAITTPARRGSQQSVPGKIFRGHILELDALRAFGIMLVILNHTWPEHGLNATLTRYVQLPWMLMDGFFVLSGFLITGILLDSRSRPDYYTACAAYSSGLLPCDRVRDGRRDVPRARAV